MNDIITKLSISDWIQFFGIITSLVTGVIAIFISISTLRQNNKMIEDSTRPFICVYSDILYIGNSTFYYLVINNSGESPAIINKFDTDFDFRYCYKISSDRDFIKSIVGCVIPSKQSRTCLLDFDKINKPVKFNLEYMTLSGKIYRDEYTLNLKAGTGLVTSVVNGKDHDLNIIGTSLQEMIKRNL